MRAFDDLVRQGKVLYWGVSEWTGVADRRRVPLRARPAAMRPISNQPQYNLLRRGIEAEVIPVRARGASRRSCSARSRRAR